MIVCVCVQNYLTNCDGGTCSTDDISGSMGIRGGEPGVLVGNCAGGLLTTQCLSRSDVCTNGDIT